MSARIRLAALLKTQLMMGRFTSAQHIRVLRVSNASSFTFSEEDGFRAVKFLYCVVCLVRCSPEQSSTKRKKGKKSSHLSGDENEQQYDYVRQTVGPEGHIWLGVNDILKEGKWTNQSEITHQPDGGHGQNCAILSSTANEKWFDEDCRGGKASVCQFNIV